MDQVVPFGERSDDGAALRGSAPGVGEGVPVPEPPGGIEGQFDLVDAHGKHLWHEGTPAETATVDGVHVVVLDRPFMHRCWNAGRRFVDLTPVIRFDGPLTSAEAASWWSKVAPAERPYG